MLKTGAHRPCFALIRHFKALRRLSTAAPEPSEQTRQKYEAARKSVTDLRRIYPEFLPDPKIEFRNPIREKLERSDMIARRANIEIPEFYVGSILAVTLSDPHTPGKFNRFVGICIKREGCGLRSTFILRNVIDHQGIEILYELYDPTIKSIEVLRLEKRLDGELLYLRDALPEYSTFDPNMEVEILPEGAPVPVNDIKVKLKPRPWVDRWERKHLKGVQDLELPQRFYDKAKEVDTPWEKYDLMKQYMRTIPEEEQHEIFSELQTHLHKSGVTQKVKRKRTFVKPTKLA
ncbi:39S ribosomal protein L19, mitochondrial-like Protein [Tribolium castaneum]|uniref:Large ribosomal subunit protein bL19m n=2 Tax=Tribolium castaneum TaxID=7070 RepID=D2A322_TRICA|nr:39S ribosomal protein L19, mitochondrial-like Protein [Tribolium castaneum]